MGADHDKPLRFEWRDFVSVPECLICHLTVDAFVCPPFELSLAGNWQVVRVRTGGNRWKSFSNCCRNSR